MKNSIFLQYSISTFLLSLSKFFWQLANRIAYLILILLCFSSFMSGYFQQKTGQSVEFWEWLSFKWLLIYPISLSLYCLTATTVRYVLFTRHRNDLIEFARDSDIALPLHCLKNGNRFIRQSGTYTNCIVHLGGKGEVFEVVLGLETDGKILQFYVPPEMVGSCISIENLDSIPSIKSIILDTQDKKKFIASVMVLLLVIAFEIVNYNQ